MKTKALIWGVILGFTSYTTAQDTIIPLWPDVIPNYVESDEKEVLEEAEIVRISRVQRPDIAVYLPSKANNKGKGVLVFPGGGYRILAYDWEGTDIAKWLNSKGIAAFVVKYRLPSATSQALPHETPLMDAQRAIRLVRGMSDTWQISSDKIGIMGFSAGGHLASTLGTHFDEMAYEAADKWDSVSARPDFMVLMYPVITFADETVHQGSREALLGKSPDQNLLRFFSTELQVTESTPPTLLIHAADDSGVPVENSIMFYKALKHKGVPASLLIYERGGHGFSLALEDAYLRTWTDQVIIWLEQLR